MRLTLRIAVLSLVLSLPAAPALAQGVAFGFKGGSVSSTFLVESVDGNDVDEFITHRRGLAGGGFLTFQGGSWLGAQVEGLYVEKGPAFEVPFEGEVFHGNVKLSYIEVPLFLRLGRPTGTIRPFLLAGPAVAMEMSCQVSVRSEGEHFDEDCDSSDSGEEAPAPARRTLDIGAVAAGGIEVHAGAFAVVFDARYGRGFRTLDESGETDVRNEALTFMAGVAWRFGRGRPVPARP